MIRVEVGREVAPAVFEYTVEGVAGAFKSHQPLLDACRLIKRMGGDTTARIGLFSAGSDVPRLMAKSVEIGAGLTVVERKEGKGVRLEAFNAFKGIDHAEL